MTNKEKAILRQLAKEQKSFKEIKGYVDCSDVTIRRYIKVFKKEQK